MKTIPHIPHHEWSDVERIAINDNQEVLIAVPTSHNLMQRPMYFEQNVPHAINVCAARASVVEKLQQAADLLPQAWALWCWTHGALAMCNRLCKTKWAKSLRPLTLI